MTQSKPGLVRHILDNDMLSMISVHCHNHSCRHSGQIPLTRFLDKGAHLDTPIPLLRRWCRCTKCGGKDVETRSTPYPRGVTGVPHMRDV